MELLMAFYESATENFYVGCLHKNADTGSVKKVEMNHYIDQHNVCCHRHKKSATSIVEKFKYLTTPGGMDLKDRNVVLNADFDADDSACLRDIKSVLLKAIMEDHSALIGYSMIPSLLSRAGKSDLMRNFRSSVVLKALEMFDVFSCRQAGVHLNYSHLSQMAMVGNNSKATVDGLFGEQMKGKSFLVDARLQCDVVGKLVSSYPADAAVRGRLISVYRIVDEPGVESALLEPQLEVGSEENQRNETLCSAHETYTSAQLEIENPDSTAEDINVDSRNRAYGSDHYYDDDERKVVSEDSEVVTNDETNCAPVIRTRPMRTVVLDRESENKIMDDFLFCFPNSYARFVCVDRTGFVSCPRCYATEVSPVKTGMDSEEPTGPLCRMHAKEMADEIPSTHSHHMREDGDGATEEYITITKVNENSAEYITISNVNPKTAESDASSDNICCGTDNDTTSESLHGTVDLEGTHSEVPAAIDNVHYESSFTSTAMKSKDFSSCPDIRIHRIQDTADETSVSEEPTKMNGSQASGVTVQSDVTPYEDDNFTSDSTLTCPNLNSDIKLSNAYASKCIPVDIVSSAYEESDTGLAKKNVTSEKVLLGSDDRSVAKSDISTSSVINKSLEISDSEYASAEEASDDTKTQFCSSEEVCSFSSLAPEDNSHQIVNNTSSVVSAPSFESVEAYLDGTNEIGVESEETILPPLRTISEDREPNGTQPQSDRCPDLIDHCPAASSYERDNASDSSSGGRDSKICTTHQSIANHEVDSVAEESEAAIKDADIKTNNNPKTYTSIDSEVMAGSNLPRNSLVDSDMLAAIRKRRMERYERRRKSKQDSTLSSSRLVPALQESGSSSYRGRVTLITQSMCIAEVRSENGHKRIVYCPSQQFKCSKHAICSHKFTSLAVGDAVKCWILPQCKKDSMWVSSSFCHTSCNEIVAGLPEGPPAPGRRCSFDSVECDSAVGSSSRGRSSDSVENEIVDDVVIGHGVRPKRGRGFISSSITSPQRQSCSRCVDGVVDKRDFGQQVVMEVSVCEAASQTIATGQIFQQDIYLDEN